MLKSSVFILYSGVENQMKLFYFLIVPQQLFLDSCNSESTPLNFRQLKCPQSILTVSSLFHVKCVTGMNLKSAAGKH